MLATCHLVVDGWGHALLAADLARGLDRVRRGAALAATAAAVVGSGRAAARAAAPPPPAAAWAWPGGGCRAGARFARQAWALGRVLHHDRGQPAAARSPTFQVPVAPGASDDPRRFARRVRRGDPERPVFGRTTGDARSPRAARARAAIALARPPATA
ncbi:MAG: hypothetical protein HS111_30430 [Kofleriaceae bacterium]|nr:hypothetical protein [Kofleriaceae bacterium]